MIPPTILSTAAEKRIGMLAITDHNTAENVSAVQEIADKIGIVVIGGMEVTSEEEAHILALFDDRHELEDFQSLVYGHLHGANSPDAFGHQWVVDAEGSVIDINPRLLIGATEMPVRRIVDEVHVRNGMAIAAHVDRQSFSILGQLGFIPEDVTFDAIELSPFYRDTGFDIGSVNTDGKLTWVTFSDAHYTAEIGRAWVDVDLEAPTVRALKAAFSVGTDDKFLRM